MRKPEGKRPLGIETSDVKLITLISASNLISGDSSLHTFERGLITMPITDFTLSWVRSNLHQKVYRVVLPRQDLHISAHGIDFIVLLH
jgi:hypothetical protein